MGETKYTFKRYETKYLLSADKYTALMERLDGLIKPDVYFSSTVCSIYYDSDDYRLIRRSIDAPVYKEKLRLRSYNVPSAEDIVFVELKKKFKGIVYKRRLTTTAEKAEAWLGGASPAPESSQMQREISWFISKNESKARVFIACDREAYVACSDSELRITFDRDLRWRNTELSLTAGSHGEPLLADGEVLMEIKIPGAAPLWLTDILSELKIYAGGFSKYGNCYKQHIIENVFNGGKETCLTV